MDEKVGQLQNMYMYFTSFGLTLCTYVQLMCRDMFL